MYSFFANVRNDPTTFGEVMKLEEKKNLKLVVEKELNSMYKNNVWNLVNELTFISDERLVNILDSR